MCSVNLKRVLVKITLGKIIVQNVLMPLSVSIVWLDELLTDSE